MTFNPIYTGGGGGGAEFASLRFFPNNSKTPLDNEMTFCHFNFTPLIRISHTLTMLIVLKCFHENLLFLVCHIIFLDGK